MDATSTSKSVRAAGSTSPTNKSSNFPTTKDVKYFDQVQLNENAELNIRVGSGVNLKFREKKNIGYVRYTCPHYKSGCTALFLTSNSWTLHANRCIFGLTRWCKEVSCIVSKTGRIGDFAALVDHAKSEHDCAVLEGGDGEMELPITLSEEFWKPEAICFSAKIIGTCAWKRGYKFNLAFVGVMFKDTVGVENKVLQIMPILYGEPGLQDQSNFFVRVKMRLLWDHKGIKFGVPCYGKLAHPSHKTNDAMTVFVGAYRSNTQMLEAIEKNETVKFLLKVQDSPVNLVLQFSVDMYRCHIPDENKWLSHAPFGLTWDELDVDEATKSILGSEELPSPVTGVFLPQFKKNMNMVIATIDPLLIIKHVLAVSKPRNTGPVNPVMIVLYPATFMLFSSAPEIIQIVKSLGLTAVLLPKSEINVTEFFQTGCNVLVTTPLILLDLLRNDLQDKWAVLLNNPLFVVIPDADFILPDGMEYKFKKCLDFFVEKVMKKIVRIAIMPHINHFAISSLSPSIVEREYQEMALGPHYTDQLKSIGATELKTRSYDEKSKAVMNIIQDNSGCTKFLIVGNERKVTYKKDFDALMNALQREFPLRHQMRRDHETQINECTFDEFKSEDQETSILLTSYYSLHYDAAKHCDCIILFDNPKRIAIMLRLLPLIKKCDGTKKKVYLINEFV